MKKVLLAVICLCLFIGLQTANAASPRDLAADKIYSVNITAYDTCPNAENAQRIAVLARFSDPDLDPGEDTLVTLDKRNKIFLTPAPEGQSFRVLASNACAPKGTAINPCTGVSGGGACLQLEDPDPENDGSLIYSVWVRLVGPQDTSIDAFLCATDDDLGNTVVCDSDHLIKLRDVPGTFSDGTNALLKFQSESLFDPDLQNYFWVWNTTGKPHAQVWFVDFDN